MNAFISTFAAGLAVSFPETLPPGVLNIKVTRITLRRGLWAAGCGLVRTGLAAWSNLYRVTSRYRLRNSWYSMGRSDT